MSHPHRRTNYFVEKKLQLKIAGLILIFTVLMAAITALIIYFSMWDTLGAKLASVYPQGRLMEIFKRANIVLLERMLIIVPIIFIVSIFISHRIAGPIYKIKKTLDEASEGKTGLRIYLRKTDELKEVADSINKVLEVLDNKSH